MPKLYVKVANGKWEEIAKKGDRGIMGLEGLAGADGRDGRDGRDGVNGKDGQDADPSVVIPYAEKAVKEHERRIDHSLIDPFLVGSKQLDEANIGPHKFLMYNGKKLVYEEIKTGLDSETIRSQINGRSTLIFQEIDGSPRTQPSVIKVSNGTLTDNGDGTITINTAGGGGSTINFADKEVPTGTINGSNVTFTLANTPTAGSEHVFLNGQLLNLVTDYTISAATITFVTAPEVGADFTTSLVVSYRY